MYNIEGNLGFGDCSKYLAYSIESQNVGFGTQASTVESFFRWAAGPEAATRGVLKNFTKFTGKHLSQNLFLIKKRLWLCSCLFCEIFMGTVFCRTLPDDSLLVLGYQVFRLVRSIIYLLKQLDSCTCTPQSCMVDRSSCSCCNTAY